MTTLEKCALGLLAIVLTMLVLRSGAPPVEEGCRATACDTVATEEPRYQPLTKTE